QYRLPREDAVARGPASAAIKTGQPEHHAAAREDELLALPEDLTRGRPGKRFAALLDDAAVLLGVDGRALGKDHPRFGEGGEQLAGPFVIDVRIVRLRAAPGAGAGDDGLRIAERAQKLCG